MNSSDSRKAPRHIPLYTAVFLAWEGEEDYHFARGRLRDLSSEGAGIAIYGAPPSSGSVWVGLEGTSMRDWVRADIVRAQQGELGAWHISLRFTMPCPIAFFRRAIWGESPMSAEASRRTLAASALGARTYWANRTSRVVELFRGADRPSAVGAMATAQTARVGTRG
jgi:hypothetical protein